MQLKNLVRKNLISCHLETPAREVAQIMEEENVGAVLVTNEGKPVGIVTDRDLTTRCLAKKENIELVTAEDVMTPSVETVLDTESFSSVVRAMKNGMVRRIVIVNEAGTPTSLLSFDDVFCLLTEGIAELRDLIKPSNSKIEQTTA